MNRYVGLVLERQEREQPERTCAGGSILGMATERAGSSRPTSFNGGRAIAKSRNRAIPLTIRVRAQAEQDLDDPVVGVLIRNRLGHRCVRHQHAHRRRRHRAHSGGRDVRGRVHLRLPADTPRLYTDRCHAVSRRLQPGLAGRRDLVFRDRCARRGGAGEFQDESELAADSAERQ